MSTYTTKNQEQITGVNCYVGSNCPGVIRIHLSVVWGQANTPGTLKMFSAVTLRGEDMDLIWKLPMTWSSVKTEAGLRGVFFGDSDGGPKRTAAGTAVKQCKKRCGWMSTEPNSCRRKVWGEGSSSGSWQGEKCECIENRRDQGRPVAWETAQGSSPELLGFLAISSFTLCPWLREFPGSSLSTKHQPQISKENVYQPH